MADKKETLNGPQQQKADRAKQAEKRAKTHKDRRKKAEKG